MGVVLLPRGSATASSLPGLAADNSTTTSTAEGKSDDLIPHVRFRGESYVPVPKPAIYPVPEAWRGGKLVLEIRACNSSHYVFSVGPEGRRSEMRAVMEVSNEPVSWGFTGEFLLFFSLVSLGREGTLRVGRG
jgi:hypothetical protein